MKHPHARFARCPHRGRVSPLGSACGTDVLRITNLTLARGTKRLLEGAQLTVHPGPQARAGRRQRLRQVEPVRRAAPRADPGRRQHRPAAGVGDRARRAGNAAGGHQRARLRARRRPRVARRRGRAGRGGGRSRAQRRSAGGPAPALRHDRRLQRPRARRHAAGRAGLRRGAARRTRRQLLRRLAHAPQSRAGADVPLRPAAARRADQSPRSRRRAVAGGLARPLSGHAAADHARPRLPRRRGRRHRPRQRAQAHDATPATTRSSSANARSSWRCSRPRTTSSSGRSRICTRSSTASAPRPPRPSRRKAASRRWSGWS